MDRTRPGWAIERELWRDGHAYVAGVDEVGRGPLAGPVVAGAVVLPFTRAHWSDQLRDSKALSASVREELAAEIREHCDCGVGVVSVQALDQMGIVVATRLAMRRALNALDRSPDALIVDGQDPVDSSLRRQPMVQRTVIGGDALCKSVAAASIIAKVARDSIMCELEDIFPGYGFAKNKGYGSSEHISALQRLGYSTVHRLSFAPVRRVVVSQ